MASIQERITQDGKKAYRVQVRLRGFPAETATFPRLTDARKWAQSTEAAMREGRYFKTSESKRHTSLSGTVAGWNIKSSRPAKDGIADAESRQKKEAWESRQNTAGPTCRQLIRWSLFAVRAVYNSLQTRL